MLLPAAGMAHEGHGASRIKAEAKVLAIKGQTMSLRIELVNLGSNSVQLQGLGTELAQDVLLANPVSVPGYDAASLKVDLQFTKAIPGVFTIYLDFGEHGRGPVVVMP
ncbi:hypothetical protein [Shimia gijangensis]|nr:hypothetical protein [Shimia gijangensis]